MYVKLVSNVSLLIMCGACALENPTLQNIEEKEGIYSWTSGALPAGSAPSVSPEFSCCENDFEAKSRPRGIRAANVIARDANGRLVSELHIRFRIDLEFLCNQQFEPSEEEPEEEPETETEGTTTEDGEEGDGDREMSKCLGTFRSVETNSPATFSRHPGGAAMTPDAERTWWDSKVEDCDGRNRKARINIAYIARYPHRGVPRVQGTAPSVLELDLKSKDGAGKDYRVRIFPAQGNLNQRLRLEDVTIVELSS